MIKIISLIFIFFLNINMNIAFAKDNPYIIFDYKKNIILEEQNSEIIWSIASLTKIMTAYIFLNDEKNLNQCKIKITEEDRDFLKFTKTRLNYNYDYNCKEIIQVMLTASDNYAASALSRFKNKENFIIKMNDYVKQIGLKNTKFVDSSGLSPENKSTAKDLFQLLVEIKKDKKVWDLISKWSTKKQITINDGTDKKFKNSNLLIRDFNYQAEVSKTGYIRESGYNLLFLEKNCNKNIGVIILGRNTSKDRANFTQNLLDKHGCKKQGNL